MNGTADGKVTNSLTVSGKPYGDDASYSTIGGNSVELRFLLRRGRSSEKPYKMEKPTT
ncbi:MAG: hypothetical protein ACLT3Y_11130 [Ruminococcus callidus]